MSLHTHHLQRTADTLEQALVALGKTDPADVVFWDLYRNAAIKSFELSLETAGKLLRRALKPYAGNPVRSMRWCSTTCCVRRDGMPCWRREK